MEAKDTVIKFQCSHKVKIGSKEWHNIEGYNLGAQTQAEISFKAGVKKVVEWIEAQRISGFTIIEGVGVGIPISEEKWQAKLKEWGVLAP